MSRRHNDEIAFSSDSFLDIVANMVGILIILIVIAGVRVSRAPIPTAHTEVTPAEQPIVAAATPMPLPEPERPEPPRSVAPRLPQRSVVPEPEPIPKFPPLPEVEVPRDMVLAARALEDDVRRLQQQSMADEQLFQTLREKNLAAEQKLRDQERQLLAQSSTLSQESNAVSTLEDQLRSMQTTVSQAQQQLARISNTPAPVKELKHQLTPLARVVTGKELHFRMYEDRVAYVPIPELGKLLQEDIQRRKDFLLSRQIFQGSVGPVAGFEMDYVLQREQLSLSEELRYGRGIVRMAVTGWILQPQPTLQTESASEALQSSSLFQRALREAGPTATVTFWVYPDSFEVHRQLKQYAQDAGYWIATRPLPEGVPISGSPQGSKSLAQ
ncbi:MAG: hypothetical protein KDA90_14625 [Planctomycetaceae bacterium]|nr:hypothetical protein [Planctomycetaceae bacterium]